MTKFHFFLFSLLLPLSPIWSQKTYTAVRLSAVPVLDGVADDSCWQQVAATAISLSSTPVFGLPALPSTVRMFYTDDALYLAAQFYGSAPRTDGSQRDATNLADWFSIGLDTWDDDQNAFVFAVTAAGIQSERRVGSNDEVHNWDAVWQSAVAQQADGWSLEIRLPFTALRFPNWAGQHWGLQLSRLDRRSGILSTWSPRQPLIGDEVLQYGTLEGIRDIQQRRRLSAYMYSRVDQAFSREEREASNSTTQGTLGIDGRWGINSASTLDVELLPSTTFYRETDDCLFCVDQLTQWQQGVPLPEPRQFLAEEQPLFDKSGISLDYPILREQAVSLRPSDLLLGYKRSHVLGSAKFSTRLPGNIGVGVRTALFSPSSIEVIPSFSTTAEYQTSEIRPVTSMANYTLITVEKALRNNSWLSLANAGSWGRLPFQNNLSSLGFQLREAGNQYQVAGNIQVNVPELRDTVYKPASKYVFSLGKVNGAWTWELNYAKNRAMSPDILNTDPRLLSSKYTYQADAQLAYHDFKNHGWRQNTSAFTRLSRRWEQATDFSSPLYLEIGLQVLSRKYETWQIGAITNLERGLKQYNFENGQTLYRLLSHTVQTALTYSSDHRKRCIYSLFARANSHLGGESANLYSGVGLTWVVTPRFQIKMQNSLNLIFRDERAFNESSTPGYFLRQFRTVQTYHQAEMTWFCSRTFNFFIRAGWTTGQYAQEKLLQITTEGKLQPVNLPFKKLAGYQDKVLDLGGQWVLAPLSQLRFQLSHYLNRTTQGAYPGIFYSQLNGSSTVASLSFIYLL